MVKLASHYIPLPHRGRTGTVYATRKQLEEVLGTPTLDDRSSDSKVTFVYVFETNEGLVHVRDYWWNPETEQSVSAETPEAQDLVNEFLKNLGVRLEDGI
jgi:outer membrane protein assembly factor BamE (lipoprotein component of BamABCDE complex)